MLKNYVDEMMQELAKTYRNNKVLVLMIFAYLQLTRSLKNSNDDSDLMKSKVS
jgi:hypothetical protein